MRASVSSLLAYRLRREHRAEARAWDWTQQELAELYRVRDRLVQSALRVALETGVTDEGEPWAVFAQSETGESFVHIARLDGEIVVANVLASVVYRGQDFRSITDQMLQDAPLVLPRPKAGGGAKVVMHPRSVFTAFVAAAIVVSDLARSVEPSQAAEQDKATPDKAAAETKVLFPQIFDRLLARDPNLIAQLGATGAATGLIAAAMGAILLTEHVGDDALVVEAQADVKDRDLAEAAVAAAVPDGASGRAERPVSIENPNDDMQDAAAQPAEIKRVEADAPAQAANRAAPVEPVLDGDGRPVGEARELATPLLRDAAASPPVIKAVAFEVSDEAPQSRPATAGEAEAARAPAESAASRSLAIILDSVIVTRLPTGVAEDSIILALDRALEASQTTLGPIADGAPTANASGAAPGLLESTDWALHAHAAGIDPGAVLDGRHDVILVSDQHVTIHNFRFNEDYIFVNGSLDATNWIQSIEISGDDVTITGVNGVVVSLVDTHGLVA